MRIRDRIHGTVAVSDAEKAVIDSPFFQRLRHIKQLGFGDSAFPGATHTRHAHSIGAMHVSSRLFDVVASRGELPEAVRSRFRVAVRMAVLCHDLGHMPLSHSSEQIAPLRGSLKLPSWVAAGPSTERALHEDFTVRLLLDSPLTRLLEKELEPEGLTPAGIASLVVGVEPPGGLPFSHQGVDWSPLLRALVSGELDADRMDYLLRDSFFTGVRYGEYDLDWLIQNLNPAVKDGRVFLALSRAASFAFEDFLLSRYHMFVSVYYHHTPVSFDWMLRRYYLTAPGEFEIPSDPEAFLGCDDVALSACLRKSKNPWAERIVNRRGYKKLAEFTERDQGYDLPALEQELTREGVEHFSAESQGTLSRYVNAEGGPSLFILDVSTQRLTEVAKYTPLYQRYSGAVRISRVYVRPDQAAVAIKALARTTGQGARP